MQHTVTMIYPQLGTRPTFFPTIPFTVNSISSLESALCSRIDLVCMQALCSAIMMYLVGLTKAGRAGG